MSSLQVLLSYQFLLILHIACIAVWFGNSISLPGRLRRGLAAGDAELKFTVNEVARGFRLSLVFGVLTLVTGLILIFTRGGFAHVGKTIHMGLGLTILMLLLQFFINRPAVRRISQIVTNGEDRSLIGPLKTRLGISSGINQLLWLVVLALMISQRGTP